MMATLGMIREKAEDSLSWDRGSDFSIENAEFITDESNAAFHEAANLSTPDVIAGLI
jgi:hypothetical protein